MKALKGIWVAIAVGLCTNGCASTTTVLNPYLPHPEQDLAVLAYWAEDFNAPACPNGAICVTSHSDFGHLQNWIKQQRSSQWQLEMIRLDVRSVGGSERYVAAWGHSERPHLFVHNLTWPQFHAVHELRSAERNELLHLGVYGNGLEQRVAAIWRPAQPEIRREKRFSKDVVVHGCTWKDLVDKDREMSCLEPKYGISSKACEPHYLVAIEAYQDRYRQQTPFFAGVWRRGNRQTALEKDGYEISHHAASLENPAYEIVLPKVAGAEQNGVSYQPVDFERFQENGNEKIAVLFRRRSASPDWLMVPASIDGVARRHHRLNVSDTGAPRSMHLLDLDLMDPFVDHDHEPCDHLSQPAIGSRIWLHDRYTFRASSGHWLTLPSRPGIHIYSEPVDFTGRSANGGHRGSIPASGFTLPPLRCPEPHHSGLIHNAGTSGPPP